MNKNDMLMYYANQKKPDTLLLNNETINQKLKQTP